MPNLSALPTTTSVAQSARFTYPILTIVGGPGIPFEKWFTLVPHRDDDRQIDGFFLTLRAGMPASVQLDKIEAAVQELRRHIAPDGTLTEHRAGAR